MRGYFSWVQSGSIHLSSSGRKFLVGTRQNKKGMLLPQERSVSFWFPVTPLAISGITLTGSVPLIGVVSQLSRIGICQRVAQGKQIMRIKSRFIKNGKGKKRGKKKELPFLMWKKKKTEGRNISFLAYVLRAIMSFYTGTQHFHLINGRSSNKMLETDSENNLL